jgi:hypothetical protein
MLVLLKVLPWRRGYLLFQWRYCVRKTQGGDGAINHVQEGRMWELNGQTDCLVDQVIMNILEETTSSKPDFDSV